MKRILCAARRPQPHSLTSSLVSGCPASGCNNSLNALWHRSIQGLNFVRGDRSKCFFQSRPKVLFACEHAITQEASALASGTETQHSSTCSSLIPHSALEVSVRTHAKESIHTMKSVVHTRMTAPGGRLEMPVITSV